MNILNRLAGWVALVQYRDACFWIGLALLGAGLSARLSIAIAAVAIGAILTLVAVFGVAPSRER
jgi:hypothetical protein